MPQLDTVSLLQQDEVLETVPEGEENTILEQARLWCPVWDRKMAWMQRWTILNPWKSFLKNHQPQPNSKSTTSSDNYRRKKRFHTFQLTRQVEELEPMTPSRPGKEMILQSRSIAGVKLDIPCERNVSWIYDEIDGHVVHMICLIVLHDPQFGSSNVISRGESKWHLKYENHVLNSVYRYDMDFK